MSDESKVIDASIVPETAPAKATNIAEPKALDAVLQSVLTVVKAAAPRLKEQGTAHKHCAIILWNDIDDTGNTSVSYGSLAPEQLEALLPAIIRSSMLRQGHKPKEVDIADYPWPPSIAAQLLDGANALRELIGTFPVKPEGPITIDQEKLVEWVQKLRATITPV